MVAEYREWYPQYSPSDVFFAATTAGRSWRAAVVEAELRAAQGSPAFAYQLDWGSPQDGGKWGAFHTLDIPLMFGTLTAPRIADRRRRGGAARVGHHAAARCWRSRAPAILTTRACRAGSRTPCRGARPWCSTSRRRLADDPRGAERRLFAKVPFIQQGT